MPIDLIDKPIAITGASSGIGRATAIACAAAGMPVAVGARREDRLRDLAEQITGAGGRAVAMAVDVSDADQCGAFIERTVAEFGSIYAVFANAGYSQEASFAEMSEPDFRAMFETNFFGSLNVIRPALGHMLGAGSGHVLLCSSCLAKLPVPRYGCYCATKAAQNHIGRAMNLELRSEGVHVSTVHPIGTRTELFDQIGARGQTELIRTTPDWSMQPPERVARAVIRCLRRPRPEVWTSTSMRLLLALSNATPTVTDRIVGFLVEQRRRQVARRAGR